MALEFPERVPAMVTYPPVVTPPVPPEPTPIHVEIDTPTITVVPPDSNEIDNDDPDYIGPKYLDRMTFRTVGGHPNSAVTYRHANAFPFRRDYVFLGRAVLEEHELDWFSRRGYNPNPVYYVQVTPSQSSFAYDHTTRFNIPGPVSVTPHLQFLPYFIFVPYHHQLTYESFTRSARAWGWYYTVAGGQGTRLNKLGYGTDNEGVRWYFVYLGQYEDWSTSSGVSHWGAICREFLTVDGGDVKILMYRGMFKLQDVPSQAFTPLQDYTIDYDITEWVYQSL